MISEMSERTTPQTDRPRKELALALANTVVMEPPDAVVDLLSTPGELRGWLDGEADRLPPEGPESGARLGRFRALRGAIRELFAAAAAGRVLPPAAVEAVNEASASAPSFLRLGSDGRAVTGTIGGDATSAILSAIARSAIEIVGGPDRSRVSVCGAPRCGRFFLARRRGQMWCTLACGNRARVARHYARRRARDVGGKS